MGESARKDTTVGDERRLHELDEECGRIRAMLPEAECEWMDSSVGMFGGGRKIDISKFRHDT